MAKVARILTSPLSIIDKDLGRFFSQIATVVITAVNPLLGAAYGALSSYGFSKTGKKARASTADRSRLTVSIDPRAPRTIVFGRTAMATDVRDQEYTGSKQEYLHRFIVVASHKVNAIQEIWFDDKRAWTSAGGVQGEYVGYLTVTPVLEGSAANAINISSRMGATRRYTGLAYVHLRYKLTGNSKKAESPFSTSVPQRVTIRGEGIAVYDPRQDSTVGGSGPHRANDQSTWTYGTHARNPALQALTYMLGWRINGILAVGKGIPTRRFDMQSFMTAANVCDESVALSGGGTEPRYRGDFVFSEADDMGLVLGQFEQTMDARFYDPKGRIAVRCMVNDLVTPIASFTAADIIGAIDWKPHGDLSERYNIVRGTYTDPSDNSLYQSVDYPEIAQTSLDGIDRIFTLDLPGVQSAAQAQRLAKRALLRAKYGGGALACEMQATAWRAEQFAPVALTFAPLGMANKKFRVEEIETRVDGTVPIVLAVEDARIYEWDAEDVEPVVAVASTPYDPENSPIVQGINQAYVEIVAPPNQTVVADYAGAALPGQFPPRVLRPIVTSAGVDIRTSDLVTYSIATAGVTATINNTTGSAEKGWITVTDGGNGYVDLTVAVDGITYGPFRIVFNKINGAAPTGTGPSGTRTTFATITSTSSFSPLFNPNTPITVAVTAGQTVTMTAPLSYNLTATATTSAALVAKWQRSPAGAGTWTDITPTTTGSAALWSSVDFSGEPGEGSFGATDTPAAGTYDYRMVAHRSGGAASSAIDIFSGTATVIVG